MSKFEVQRYTTTAISLHWLIALLIFAGWGLGFYMADLPLSPAKLRYFSWHKWIGVTVFLLAMIRVAWLATHAAPRLPNAISPWQARTARVSHSALYLLMFAIPVSGWLMSSAKGVQTIYFGILPIPNLIGKDKALGQILSDVHESLAYVLAALVVVHIAAALKHHFIEQDGVLKRMIPFLESPGSNS
ncbi:MAG: cytochrome b [Gammaproteobacteria bacterium]|nr:cytochrome b [Gammaproteobacteria bacterium]